MRKHTRFHFPIHSVGECLHSNCIEPNIRRGLSFNPPQHNTNDNKNKLLLTDGEVGSLFTSFLMRVGDRTAMSSGCDDDEGLLGDCFSVLTRTGMSATTGSASGSWDVSQAGLVFCSWAASRWIVVIMAPLDGEPMSPAAVLRRILLTSVVSSWSDCSALLESVS